MSLPKGGKQTNSVLVYIAKDTFRQMKRNRRGSERMREIIGKKKEQRKTGVFLLIFFGNDDIIAEDERYKRICIV